MRRSSTSLAGRRIAYLTPSPFQGLIEGGQGKRRVRATPACGLERPFKVG
jgi:hypothetical protein